MTLGPQFEQPELPGMPAPDRKGPARRSLDYKQQQQEAGVGMTRAYSDNKLNKFAESPMESRTPTESFHKRGDQLKMFMTPREIEHEWQPLDADREDSYEPISQGTDDTRAGSNTKRPERTDGVPNVYVGYRNSADTFDGSPRRKPNFRRPSVDHPVYEEVEGGESTPALWDRKYDEATESGVHGQHSYGMERPKYVNSEGKDTDHSAKHVVRLGNTRKKVYNGSDGASLGYKTTGGGYSDNSRHRSSSWHFNDEKEEPYMSMADSVASEGVKSPIRLSTRYGSEGKPEMVGGHHRMAVARVHSPDQFAPVLYHTDIYEARSGRTTQAYKYT